MLFNSFSFLLFYPLVTCAYFLLPHRFRWFLLLAASCVFYGAFIPAYLLILAFTIVVDYFGGLAIEKAQGKRRRLMLIMCIAANVGVLAVFKYANFMLENLGWLAHMFRLDVQPPLLNIILPIGLSFHTFQAMSYNIEVYRGHQKAERHFGIYALYVMFYPQLVAGPIERPQNLLPQFRAHHRFSVDNLLRGLRLMLWGLFKKAVIADRIAVYVNAVYANPGDYHYLNLIIATLFFAVQIYCDFSGYSDMAIGAAKTMGFELMINFNRPYFAANIQEFWRRWHISLTTWFRDYLYFPLGGNRRGPRRTYINLMIVFLVSGLWHGASWTFVIWGALHGLFLLGYNWWKGLTREEESGGPVIKLLSILGTFAIVSFAWIFFRARSVGDAMQIIAGIFQRHRADGFLRVVHEKATDLMFGNTSMIIALMAMGAMFLVEHRLRPDLATMDGKPGRDLAFCTVVLTLIILFGVFNKTGFIYFQF